MKDNLNALAFSLVHDTLGRAHNTNNEVEAMRDMARYHKKDWNKIVARMKKVKELLIECEDIIFEIDEG